MNKMYRQGDWLFIAVENVPDEIIYEPRDERGRLIVGEGEATGHAHAIVDQEAKIAVLDGKRWLLASESVEVIHEEHDTVTLPAGSYELRWQMVYERGQLRKVLD